MVIFLKIYSQLKQRGAEGHLSFYNVNIVSRVY